MAPSQGSELLLSYLSQLVELGTLLQQVIGSQCCDGTTQGVTCQEGSKRADGQAGRRAQSQRRCVEQDILALCRPSSVHDCQSQCDSVNIGWHQQTGNSRPACDITCKVDLELAGVEGCVHQVLQHAQHTPVQAGPRPAPATSPAQSQLLSCQDDHRKCDSDSD